MTGYIRIAALMLALGLLGCGSGSGTGGTGGAAGTGGDAGTGGVGGTAGTAGMGGAGGTGGVVAGCGGVTCDTVATCDTSTAVPVCVCLTGYSDDNGDGTVCTRLQLVVVYPFGNLMAVLDQDGFLAGDFDDPATAGNTCDGTAVVATFDLIDASGTFTITGANGTARHPVTGDLFIAVKVTGGPSRLLGTVDPNTGLVTIIGNMGDRVAGLAFDNDANLIAVTGDGATTPEALFLVDQSDASMRFIINLGAGSDGEVIRYNPDDGHLYHWSGRDIDPAFDRIALNIDLSDPLNPVLGATVTPIIRNGYNYDEPVGVVYGWPSPTSFGLFNIGQEVIEITVDASDPMAPTSMATLITTTTTLACNPGPSTTGSVDTMRGGNLIPL